MERQNQRGGRVYHRAARPMKSASRTFGESADWSDHQGCEALYTNRPVDLLKCLRPSQWIKNLLLVAAPFFAYCDKRLDFAQSFRQDPRQVLWMLGAAIGAFILFSATAYVFNDLVDARRDASNPIRKNRPIAARKVSLGAAIGLGVVCLALGGALTAWIVRSGCTAFLFVAVGYVVLQPIYTYSKRAWAEFGSLLLAGGFVLRAVAGAVVVGVKASPWLLLCVFLAALFVALCKRRSAHFVRALPQPSAADARILDLEVAICASATVACYALYTLSAETCKAFGSCALAWTIPLVILGIFRYLRLTYGEHSTGSPETAVARDPAMLVIVLAWAVACVALLRVFA